MDKITAGRNELRHPQNRQGARFIAAPCEVETQAPQKDDDPPGCRHCGSVMTTVGKLPAMGLKPFVEAFRCKPLRPNFIDRD